MKKIIVSKKEFDIVGSPLELRHMHLLAKAEWYILPINFTEIQILSIELSYVI